MESLKPYENEMIFDESKFTNSIEKKLKGGYFESRDYGEEDIDYVNAIN